MNPAKTRCFVVSHTHWDREWYRTFQSFRFRLVSLLDELIEEMDANPGYRFFHLDGQTIVLEDYAEIRPDRREKLERLIREGRIIVGPWFVMPDEFLLSGESLVRNLLLGRVISRSWGSEPMPVGYVVDIFGHNSQFPQIMRGFGIDSAVLYRGIGDYPRDLFDWVGADGSRILAVKLDNERSYSNFYFALRRPFEDRRQDDDDELVRRAGEVLAFSRERAVSENILMLDGVDHMEMDPGVPRILETLNRRIEDASFEHARLTDYIAAQKDHPDIEEIRGELYHVGRRGVNNQLLKNVLSSMVHLKQMNDRCELGLTRWAEPLNAGTSSVLPRDMQGFLDTAWKLLMQNHPHDSICGCSITRVHEDNVHRFDQVGDITENIIDVTLRGIAESVEEAGSATDGRNLVVFNAGQREYRGIITAKLILPRHTQGNIRLHDPDGVDVPFQVIGTVMDASHNIFRDKRLPHFSSSPEVTVSFQGRIPPMGYAAYRYTDLQSVLPGPGDFTFTSFHPPKRLTGSMRVSPASWYNGRFILSVNPDGAVSLEEKESGKRYDSLYYFEDGGDAGDGWNYRKPAHDRLCLSCGSPVHTEVEADGPYTVVLGQTHTLSVPVSSDIGGRSEEYGSLKVLTKITMHRDRTTIEFETSVDNTLADHRLRVVFPTNMETGTFHTATPFCRQERAVEREDTHDAIETDTGVVPSQGVTILSDSVRLFSVYARGLYEVEVFQDAARAVALTLFRSFSREIGMMEGGMGRMKRRMTFQYAIDIRSVTEGVQEAFITGMDWRCGTRSVSAHARLSDGPALSRSTSFLTLRGKDVVLSSYRLSDAGRHLVRIYNAGADATRGTIVLPFDIVDVQHLLLDEETTVGLPGCKKTGSSTISFELAPAEIATFAVVPS